MKYFVCKAVSLLCALSIVAVSLGLAYQSGAEVEATVTELEEMASSIAEIYESEPIENPDEIEFLDMSTEEIIESSNEYIAEMLKNQDATYGDDPADEQIAVDEVADNDESYVDTGNADSERHGEYSTEGIESEVSFFTFSSAEERVEEVISEESVNGNSEPTSEETASSEPQSEAPVSSQTSSEAPSSSQGATSSNSADDKTVTGDTVILKVNGVQCEMLASEILPIFVAYEMSASWSAEALKTQAVATFTYIKYYNTVYDKAVVLPTLGTAKSEEAKSAGIKNACSAVAGEMIYYNGKIIDAQYCAAMASYTRNASDVYQSGSYAYLTSVESKYESYGPDWDSKVYIDASEFKSLVTSYFNADLGLDSISPENWIQIVNYTADGYTNKVKIGNYETTGWGLYKATGGKTKSAWFTVTYNSSTQQFVFTTRGYGHSVGMSQRGALYYAIHAGWTYKQILTHYYSGTTVK